MEEEKAKAIRDAEREKRDEERKKEKDTTKESTEEAAGTKRSHISCIHFTCHGRGCPSYPRSANIGDQSVKGPILAVL